MAGDTRVLGCTAASGPRAAVMLVTAGHGSHGMMRCPQTTLLQVPFEAQKNKSVLLHKDKNKAESKFIFKLRQWYKVEYVFASPMSFCLLSDFYVTA